MYKTGQTVLYSSNGVCKITEITQKNIGGKNVEYYALKPVCSNNSTLFVPTHSEALVSKMRPILSACEIKAVLASIDGNGGEWIDDKNERLEKWRGIICGGDLISLVMLIRVLHERRKIQEQKGRRLHISDERYLKEAEKMVCDEISIALNIERGEVIPLILR